jgi:hypothetical protein
MKLSSKALGLTLGILWGLGLFVMTLLAASNGYAADQLGLLVGVYPWYEVTTQGAFIGLGLGFLDGFIGGWIIAWVYNKCLSCIGCGCKGKCKC